jgi:hypothetical protein
MSLQGDNGGGRYAIQVRAPTSLADAVKTAADRELMTVSEYIRRTLIDRLRHEGIDPSGKRNASSGVHDVTGFAAAGER